MSSTRTKEVKKEWMKAYSRSKRSYLNTNSTFKTYRQLSSSMSIRSSRFNNTWPLLSQKMVELQFNNRTKQEDNSSKKKWPISNNWTKSIKCNNSLSFRTNKMSSSKTMLLWWMPNNKRRRLSKWSKRSSKSSSSNHNKLSCKMKINKMV